MSGSLFDTGSLAPAADDPVDPRHVACSTCGAEAGNPCRAVLGPEGRTLGYGRSKAGRVLAHQVRWAASRFTAGLADEPTPRLFDPEGEAVSAPLTLAIDGIGEGPGDHARFLGRCRDCKRPVSRVLPGLWREHVRTASYGHRVVSRYFAPHRLPVDRTLPVREGRLGGVFTDCPGCGRSVHLEPVQGSHRADVPCDSRCTGARGPQCECSCGGANHGAAWGA